MFDVWEWGGGVIKRWGTLRLWENEFLNVSALIQGGVR